MSDMESRDDRYDLGVLLVHGIGQQARGDTLVRLGDAMQSWLERWMGRKSAPGSNELTPVVDARFTPPADDLDAPGHAELQLACDATSDGRPARWLLAETWWASTVLPPTYADLAAWGVQILPWTLTTHFATRARRVLHGLRAARGVRRIVAAGRLLLELVGFLAMVMLLPALVSLLILVLVVGMLPIPRIRSIAAQLQLVLSATLGDSFVLMASPIQEAAIIGRVERDLRWLAAKRCRRLAVVAHSQGAAIAHAALRKFGLPWHAPETPSQPEASARQDAPANITTRTDRRRSVLFVTVGSGLNKLAEIRSIRNTSKPASVWSAPIGLLMLAFALPEVFTSFRNSSENFLATYVAIGGLLLFLIGVASAWRENRPKAAELALGPGVLWLDFYASSDPVPNGPMFDSTEATRELMEAREVHNLASPLADHVSYWRNEDDFLAQLICALGAHGALQLCREKSMDRSHLAVAMLRRRWRVRWLLAMRLLVITLTATVGIRYWDALPAATEAGLQVLTPMLKRIPFAGDLLPPLNEITVVSKFVGAGALALFGIGAYYALYAAWASWNRSDVAAFFDRDPFAPMSTSFLKFVLLLVVVAEAFVLTIAGYGDGLLAGLVAAATTWGLVLILLTMLLGFFAGTMMLLWGAARALWQATAEWVRAEPWERRGQRVVPAAATSAESTTPRLIDWRERGNERRSFFSLFALILLTFPYLAVVAASIASSQLWAEGWWWRHGLLSTIESTSNALIVPEWQWLLGSFVLVVGANLATGLGVSRGLRRWATDAAYAGPIAVSHANQLPKEEALAVLRQGASLLRQDYDKWEAVLESLRTEEAAAPDGKAQIEVMVRPGKSIRIASGSAKERACAQQLRSLAHEASEIAARLPNDDQAGLDLLARVARTSPEAAMTLAQRIGHVNPGAASEHLQRHANQPGYLLRLRVRRALARIARLQQLPMAS